MLRAVDTGKFDELRRSICNVPDQLSDNSHAANHLQSLTAKIFDFSSPSAMKSRELPFDRRQEEEEEF